MRFGINPALARIVKEAVTEDEARFVEEEEKMSGDKFGKKLNLIPRICREVERNFF